MGSVSGCGDLYRSRLSHRTVPHPTSQPQPVGSLQQCAHAIPDSLLEMVAANGVVVADRGAAKAVAVRADAAILAVLRQLGLGSFEYRRVNQRKHRHLATIPQGR